MLNRTLLSFFIALFITACSHTSQIVNPPNLADYPVATITAINQPKALYADGTLRVYFADDTTELPSNLLTEASPLIQTIKKKTVRGKVLGISAYTPSTGDVAKNSYIMKNRGVAVRQFLEENGVPETQIKFVKPATRADESFLLNGNPVEVFIFEE